jgi:hypothetical protein
VQKRKNLLARSQFAGGARRENTTLLNHESDISVRKYLFLLKYDIRFLGKIALS